LIRRALTNGQWRRIEPLIPGKEGDKGRHGEDNRLFVDAVLWLVRAGAGELMTAWRQAIELAIGEKDLAKLGAIARSRTEAKSRSLKRPQPPQNKSPAMKWRSSLMTIDAQNLRHLLFELRVTSFQVVAHLVWLYFLPIEYVAQRTLSQFGKAAVPLCRALLARMAGEEPRRPQFVRIPEFLGLAAGEVHDPSLGLGRDRGLLAGPGPIIERRHWAIGHSSPLNTALINSALIAATAHGTFHLTASGNSTFLGPRPGGRLQDNSGEL
jgi:hypothetical protein